MHASYFSHGSMKGKPLNRAENVKLFPVTELPLYVLSLGVRQDQDGFHM